ncbi:hypothetical protein M9H77_12350 [Catharanthus roseus]|uniref:Uncharacterized protein n=1 Tax=Catharanthus roseus TaxID=4058 RepID=A0ACC0BH43_CATRO|nr:hypothetical protein M9H77_12350 [Catharanthus roseus]
MGKILGENGRVKPTITYTGSYISSKSMLSVEMTQELRKRKLAMSWEGGLPTVLLGRDRLRRRRQSPAKVCEISATPCTMGPLLKSRTSNLTLV